MAENTFTVKSKRPKSKQKKRRLSHYRIKYVDMVTSLTDPGSWFEPELGLLSVWSFACSLKVQMGFLVVLWFPPTVP